MSLDRDVSRFWIGEWRALGGGRGRFGNCTHRGDDFKPQEEEEEEKVDGVVGGEKENQEQIMGEHHLGEEKN